MNGPDAGSSGCFLQTTGSRWETRAKEFRTGHHWTLDYSNLSFVNLAELRKENGHTHLDVLKA